MRKTLSCLLLFLLFSVVYSAVPGQVSFQGILKDSTGSPITGLRDITFYLYPTASGAGALWNETQTVSIEAGLYNVRLGSTTPLTAALFDGNTKYLGISIGGLELLPRVVIVTVPYALRAEAADRATYADAAGSSGAAASAVTFAPLTQQTTNAVTAVWLKNTKVGSGSYYYSTISAEASGAQGVAVAGYATDTGALTNTGGWFAATSTTGRGVMGQALGTTGALNYGGHFTAKGTSGRGVYGEANSSTGITYGGLFVSNSTTGTGVYGAGSMRGVYGYSGYLGGYGVHGIGAGADGGSGGGIGVRGEATYSNTMNRGGYFTAAGNQDQTAGIYGAATNPLAGGSTYGGYFSTAGPIGDSAGVYGEASNALTGTLYGGKFTSAGSGGSAGVYGWASNWATDGPTYGGSFSSVSDQPGTAGVYGRAENTGVNATFGGDFTTNSTGSDAAGVRGYASNPMPGGTTYGGYFSTASPVGYAAKFEGGRGIILPVNNGPLPIAQNGTIIYDSGTGHFYGYGGIPVAGWHQLD